MSDLNGVVGYARRWIELHRENKFQREAAKIMQRVVDALESVRAERDAALARIAELEPKYPEGWSTEDRQAAYEQAALRWGDSSTR